MRVNSIDSISPMFEMRISRLEDMGFITSNELEVMNFKKSSELEKMHFPVKIIQDDHGKLFDYSA